MSKILLKSALWSIGLFLFMNLVSYLLDPEQFMSNFKYDYKRDLSIMVGIFTVIGFWLFFMVVFSVRHYFVKRKQSRALLIDEVERSPSDKKAAVKRVLLKSLALATGILFIFCLGFFLIDPINATEKIRTGTGGQTEWGKLALYWLAFFVFSVFIFSLNDSAEESK
ncbi:MAG: hypothetical protein WBA17_08070 [Saprospiraceae bacterium]